VTAVSDLDLRLLAQFDPVGFFTEATGYEPQPWQPDYLREERHAITLKGRQVGASTATGCTAIRLALLRPRSTSLIVSPSLNQSKEVRERAGGHAERLGLRLLSDSASTIELENHSRIVSLPGSKKSVRGWTASALLVIDEAAFLDPATFLASRAIAATSQKSGAMIRIQSTPSGPFGHFHDLWEHPDEGWAKFFVTSEQVDTIGDDFLATERATLTAEEYAQEYLGSFGSPGLGLVDPKRLEELVAKPAAEEADPWAKVRRTA
jgi:hypothetical protein